MNDAPQRGQACRIIVGLRPDPGLDLSLEAATMLAAAIEAEVVGLYVQEDAMLDLAALPFARAFAPGMTGPRRLTRDAMSKAFAQGATTCRRVLSEHAKKARVSWSFSQERGELTTRIRSAVDTGDFLVLSGDRLGIGARQLIDELRKAPRDVRGVLVTVPHREMRLAGPVIAIDDGDAAGEETVLLASRIAQVTNAHLELFAIAATDAEANRIAQRAADIEAPGLSIRTHRFVPGAPETIAPAFSQLGPSFIVADEEGEPFDKDQSARILLRAARAPVLLIRSKKADNE